MIATEFARANRNKTTEKMIIKPTFLTRVRHCEVNIGTLPRRNTPLPTTIDEMMVPNTAKTRIEPMFWKKLPCE